MHFFQELSANIQTIAELEVGDEVTSQLEIGSDTDWFRVELTAGERYQFDLTSDGGGVGLSDPLLRLYQNGHVIEFDDDDGPGLDPRIVFTAPTSGTYYLEAASPETQSGQYRLTAANLSQPTAPTEAPSLTDAIDWGTSVGKTTINVYFAEQGDTFAGYTSFGWTDEEISQATAAFAEFEAVTNLTFNRVSAPDQADFKLVIAAPVFFAGTMFAPGEENEGVGIFSRSALNSGDGLVKGGFGFNILLHEFSHGLGLAHPHDTGGSSSILSGVDQSFGDYGDYDLNQGVYTILSYNTGYRAETGREPERDFGVTGTPSPIDLAVLQERYGAREDANAGATRYELPSINAVGTYYSAIWDTSGTDWLIHNGSADATLDLRAATLELEEGGGGYVSRVDGIFGGFTIANGVVIERARGGSGDDLITGNDANNRLEGRAGNDTLIGGRGIDTLLGGDGADTFVFGAEDHGAQILDFESSDILLFDTNSAANVALNSARQSGSNAVLTVNGSDLTLHYVDHGNLVRTGREISLQLASGEGENPAPSFGNDVYSYRKSDGSLAISAEQETEDSGSADRLVFEDLALTDVVFTSSSGDLEIAWQNENGSGSVRVADGGAHIESFEFTDGSVLSSVDITSLQNGESVLRVETAIPTSNSDILFGSNAANEIDLFSGDDRYFGLAGNDVVTGGSGADYLNGGIGRDDLRGNTGNDTLIGGLNDDLLRGDLGDDTLLGGIGADHVRGGSGDDVALGGAGIDILFGETGNDDLRGNDGNDVIVGGVGDDLLRGDAGDDTLNGGQGGDKLIGGNGTDAVTYVDAGSGVTVNLGNTDVNTGQAAGDTFNSIEKLIGSRFGDSLFGDAKSNYLNGSDGNDTLSGRAGSDIIKGGSGADAIRGGSGDDTADGGLGVDAIFGESGNDNLRGGGGEDVIHGGGGADLLRGDAGDDTLIGGGGGDKLIGGRGADTFVFYKGSGTDTVQFEDDKDKIELRGTGLSFDDLIINFGDGASSGSVDYGTGTILIESGRATVNLTSDDFIFT